MTKWSRGTSSLRRSNSSSRETTTTSATPVLSRGGLLLLSCSSPSSSEGSDDSAPPPPPEPTLSQEEGVAGVLPKREGLETETRRHDFLRQQIHSFIAQWRDRIGLEPLWRIEVECFCPPSSSSPAPNASISWVRDSWQAVLRIRCDLPYQERRRETLHELVELAFHGTGELWYLMRSHLLQTTDEQRERGGRALLTPDLWNYLDDEYRVRRNQEVERVVRLLLQQDDDEEGAR